MDAANVDDHMTSAAAFVEGGVQDACDDACSICLEDFTQSDPSTVTNCKHEFHLQCILEWCQRSSNCPMCWQEISLKDATSQELLEAVERERISKANRSRTPTVFHHPALGEFDLQHVFLYHPYSASFSLSSIFLEFLETSMSYKRVVFSLLLQLSLGAGDVDLEEHIFQHLAAAAAMRRGHLSFRRESQRNRSSSQARHPFFISTAPSRSHSIAGSPSTSSAGGSESPAVSMGSGSMPLPSSLDARALPVSLSPAETDQISGPRAESNFATANQQRILSGTRSFAGQPPPGSQDTGGPSDLQSLSESLKSRFSAWSMRYKESFSRNTRGWKERLFSRSTSMAEVGSEGQREVNSGIANVSRMMHQFDGRGNDGAGHTPGSSEGVSRSNTNNSENGVTHICHSEMSACATSSASD